MNFDPGCLRVQHHMRTLWGYGQISINCGGKWVHERRPSWVPLPKRSSALFTKMSLPGTLPNFPSFGITNFCLVDTDTFLSFNFECSVICTQINGISTTARSFPADRTITPHERIRVIRIDREPDRFAITGAFKPHLFLRSQTLETPGLAGGRRCF